VTCNINLGPESPSTYFTFTAAHSHPAVKYFAGILMMKGVGVLVSQSRIWRAAGSYGLIAIPRQVFTHQVPPQPKALTSKWPTGEWKALFEILTLVAMMSSLIVKVCRLNKIHSSFAACSFSVVCNDISNLCACTSRVFEQLRNV
jgi:hypothetical protein